MNVALLMLICVGNIFAHKDLCTTLHHRARHFLGSCYFVLKDVRNSPLDACRNVHPDAVPGHVQCKELSSLMTRNLQHVFTFGLAPLDPFEKHVNISFGLIDPFYNPRWADGSSFEELLNYNWETEFVAVAECLLTLFVVTRGGFWKQAKGFHERLLCEFPQATSGTICYFSINYELHRLEKRTDGKILEQQLVGNFEDLPEELEQDSQLLTDPYE